MFGRHEPAEPVRLGIRKRSHRFGLRFAFGDPVFDRTFEETNDVLDGGVAGFYRCGWIYLERDVTTYLDLT